MTMKKKGYIIILISLGFLCINAHSLYSWNVRDNINSFKKESPRLSWNLAWDANGVAIGAGSGNQYPSGVICYDNQDKIFIWADWTDHNIYTKRIDVTEGYVKTTVICNESGTQRNPKQCPDDDEGAIICWEDSRNATNFYDIFAQKINSSGDSVWLENGIVVCSEVSYQDQAKICSDGFGGAIIVWEDRRSKLTDIYAQRVNSSGHIKWNTNGNAICTAEDTRGGIQILSDGNGGAIIAWIDRRNGDYDVYAQRINSSGNVQWGGNGTIVFATNETEGAPQICNDLNGGFIISCLSGLNEVRAQRMSQTGNPLWINNGVIVCNTSGEKNYPIIITDNTGGAILIWSEDRESFYGKDIYAQRIDSNGVNQWADNGSAICIAAGDQYNPVVCTDGAGGAIITWTDQQNYNIYAQRVNSAGITKWTEYGFNGILICETNGYTPLICSDNEGGAIIMWYDTRYGNTDSYAQNIKNSLPNSNSPEDIISNVNDNIFISWVLTDDCDGGMYRVLINNSLLVDWTSWSNSTSLIIPINTTNSGSYNYEIEFYDDQNQNGISDSVVVTVITPIQNDTNEIPFGFYFIVFTLMGIILLIFKKYKLLK
jgi:hypothetical protein